jgi:hypothetical protein
VSADRTVRAIENARRFVMARNTSRALRLLGILRSIVDDSETRFELETLRIQALIDQSNFREAELELEKLRTHAVQPDHVDLLELLDAHRLSRIAAARPALRQAFAVLRRQRAGDRAAKAYWIAGVALYRTAHYKWAKDQSMPFVVEILRLPTVVHAAFA